MRHHLDYLLEQAKQKSLRNKFEIKFEPFSKLNQRERMFPIDRYLRSRIFSKQKKDNSKFIYRHYNEESVDRTVNQKHHNVEHHLIIVKMVLDYSEHRDLAIQNLTNELSDEIHLSKSSFNSISSFSFL